MITGRLLAMLDRLGLSFVVLMLAVAILVPILALAVPASANIA